MIHILQMFTCVFVIIVCIYNICIEYKREKQMKEIFKSFEDRKEMES